MAIADQLQQEEQAAPAPVTAEKVAAPTDPAATAPAPAPTTATVAPTAPAGTGMIGKAGATVQPLPKLRETETAAEKVQKMTTQESPLLKTAETRALQQAQARGMISSSLAEQAAQQAVIETATPLATQAAQQEQQAAQMEFQTQMQERERQLDEVFKQKQIDTARSDQLKGEYRERFTQQQQQFDSQMAEIMNTPDSVMSPEQKRNAVSQLKQTHQLNVGNMNSMYESMPEWDQSWSMAAPAGQAGAPTKIDAATVGASKSFDSPASYNAAAERIKKGQGTAEDQQAAVSYAKYQKESLEKFLSDADAKMRKRAKDYNDAKNSLNPLKRQAAKDMKRRMDRDAAMLRQKRDELNRYSSDITTLSGIGA